MRPGSPVNSSTFTVGTERQNAIEDNKVDIFLVKFSVLTYYTFRRERGEKEKVWTLHVGPLDTSIPFH